MPFELSFEPPDHVEYIELLIADHDQLVTSLAAAVGVEISMETSEVDLVMRANRAVKLVQRMFPDSWREKLESDSEP